MIREKIIKYLTRKNILNRKSPGMEPYQNVSKIGILFNSANVNYEEIKKLKEELETDNKTIHTLGYAAKMDGPVIYDVVAKREVSLTGKIKSPEFEKFSDTNYDYFLVLDRSTDYNLSYLASLCHANCKIGFFHEDEPGVIDFQLKSEKGSECSDLMKYLKMIK